MRKRLLRERLLVAAICGSALLLPIVAFAHDLNVARVTIAMGPSGYVLQAKLPAGFDAPAPIVPAGYAIDEPPRVRDSGTYRSVRYQIQGPTPAAPGDVIRLAWDREGAFVQTTWGDGSTTGRFFRQGADGIEIPMVALRESPRTLLDTVRHYFVLGIEHIVLGWDHLAFVLCLCLIATGWKLAKLVTAFTIGHSLTLAAAVLGLAHVPIPPVEACIALSIAFVAREALVHGTASKHGWRLVLAFGLLHGLGFASALRASGIHSSEILPGLISFNIGIEIGQLAFVLAIGALARATRRLTRDNTLARPMLARGLGTAALYWTVTRIAGFVA